MKFSRSNHSKWDDFFFYSYWVLYKLHEQEDWLPLILVLRVPCRDVTRLHGARDKKQVWRPHIWNWGVLEAYVLYWKEVLATLLGLFGTPIVTRPRGITPPLPLLVTPLVPWPAVFCVVAVTCSYMGCKNPKTISSYENGCTIQWQNSDSNKVKNCFEN